MEVSCCALHSVLWIFIACDYLSITKIECWYGSEPLNNACITLMLKVNSYCACVYLARVKKARF